MLQCLISRTVRTNAFIFHGGFPLWALMNWSHSSLLTPAVCYTVGWLSSTSIWIGSHSITCCIFYTCCFLIYLLFSNVPPGSYFPWLQLQRCCELTGACVVTMSHWVANCLKCLSSGLFRLQLHLVEVFLDPWLAVVEWWGRWSQKEVGSPGHYRVSYQSRCNEWQPTWTINSSWIHLRIAAGDANGPAICSKLVRCCVFICMDLSRWPTADISVLIDMFRTFSDRKDIWWCSPQEITRNLHESQSNH
jgi:hypothetical protein